MGANQLPNVWLQRRKGMLMLPPNTQQLRAANANYLHPVILEGSDEMRYYFKSEELNSLSNSFEEYTFEEAFWLLPDFFEFVEYTYKKETNEVNIPLRDTMPNPPREVEYTFEKVLLNLARGETKVLTPGAIHPCDGNGGGPAGATSNNCMAPLRTEDGNFILMYAKNTGKEYVTDASETYVLRLNNYFIPLLSADMSIWWYKIPNYKLSETDDALMDKWQNEAHARENAEKMLSIWHQDQEAFEAAISQYPGLEAKFYVGVYQRSYFCDELQMRFTNAARIGNDNSIPVSYRIQDYSTIHYKALKANFPTVMLRN